MTRLCMDCGTELGEKCPRCGCAVIVNARDLQCGNCGLEWTRGTDGCTHGICDRCTGLRMLELRTIQTVRTGFGVTVG